jgi:acetylornithine deacetylase/succinyl-diaminopimelate desuccinylase-like protein
MNTPSALEILQVLLRFDTTNPPGNEAACVNYIASLLGETGVACNCMALDDARPNLIARLDGRGQAPPLLLYGHVDVVTTQDQFWTHAPFAAEIDAGYLWGRGTLDMKGGVAMMVAAFLRTAAADTAPPGDVILCVLSDEEALGTYGAQFMVERHPEQFAGVRHAIGEFGGFTLTMGGKRFYPIMVAEKQACWMTATFQGPGGHGSMPIRGGAMSKLAQFLAAIDRRRLPVHISEPARLMFEAVAAELPFPQSAAVRALLNPILTNPVLDALGDQGHLFDALLHNTVSPSILHGCTKINVIPSEVSVELDGRLLPGQTPDDMLRELRDLAGAEAELAIATYDPCPAELDMTCFDMLSEVLRDADPQGKPIPLLLSGVTDGRFFARLGIQTYGFTPMRLPADFNFSATIHAADERIPVDAPEFGASAIYQAVQRYSV